MRTPANGLCAGPRYGVRAAASHQDFVEITFSKKSWRKSAAYVLHRFDAQPCYFFAGAGVPAIKSHAMRVAKARVDQPKRSTRVVHFIQKPLPRFRSRRWGCCCCCYRDCRISRSGILGWGRGRRWHASAASVDTFRRPCRRHRRRFHRLLPLQHYCMRVNTECFLVLVLVLVQLLLCCAVFLPRRSSGIPTKPKSSVAILPNPTATATATAAATLGVCISMAPFISACIALVVTIPGTIMIVKVIARPLQQFLADVLCQCFCGVIPARQHEPVQQLRNAQPISCPKLGMRPLIQRDSSIRGRRGEWGKGRVGEGGWGAEGGGGGCESVAANHFPHL